MEIYQTEQEQIEAIKKFLNKYGNNLLLGLVIFFVMFIGYHYWLNRQHASAEQASEAYNALRELVSNNGNLSAEDKPTFDKIYAGLMENHADSLYASYASLLRAKLDVENKALDKAAQTLQWVIDAKATPEIVALAQLRLANVYFAQGDDDKALKMLDTKPGPFGEAYEELRGDIYVEQNKKDLALEAYKKAKSIRDENSAASTQILDIKINSLSAADPSKLVTPPEPTMGGAVSESAAKQ